MTMLAQRDWHPMSGGHWGWGMSGMWLFWILVLAALIAIPWLILRQRNNTAGDDAEEILRKRYARGEIDRTTYDQMLGDLRKDAPLR